MIVCSGIQTEGGLARHPQQVHQQHPQLVKHQPEELEHYGIPGRLVLSGKAEKEQWRAAMERSKRVLTSQEQAMEEYLRRQRKEAEKHIRNSPLLSRRGADTHPGRQGGIVSMPGTPTGSRRNGARHRGVVLQDPVPTGRNSRAGSLERQACKPGFQDSRAGTADTVSDSEYMRGNFRPSPAKDNSRSLPKGTSALNYGLLMGQIQQKRAARQKTDGSVSDSNYSTYGELRGGWLQPASTYSGWSHKEERGSMESINSINSISSSIKAARSHGLTQANLLQHQLETHQAVQVNPARALSR